MLEAFLISVLAGVAANLATPSAKVAIAKVLAALKERYPTAIAQIEKMLQVGDFAGAEKQIREIAGSLTIEAGQGKVEGVGSGDDILVLKALSALSIDHQNGSVYLEKALLEGKTVTLGGSGGATGETKITGSKVQSTQGAGIDAQGNASLKVTKDAKIELN